MGTRIGVICIVLTLGGCDGGTTAELKAKTKGYSLPAAPRNLSAEQFEFMRKCASTRNYGYRIERAERRFAYCLDQVDLLWSKVRVVTDHRGDEG